MSSCKHATLPDASSPAGNKARALLRRLVKDREKNALNSTPGPSGPKSTLNSSSGTTSGDVTSSLVSNKDIVINLDNAEDDLSSTTTGSNSGQLNTQDINDK